MVTYKISSRAMFKPVPAGTLVPLLKPLLVGRVSVNTIDNWSEREGLWTLKQNVSGLNPCRCIRLSWEKSFLRRPTVCRGVTPKQGLNLRISWDAKITVLRSITSAITDIGVDRVVDDISGLLLGHSFSLELVAAELDSAGAPKETVKGQASFDHQVNANELKYVCRFDHVPADFGEIGAVLVQNDLRNEIFLKKIVVNDSLTISCESFVHSKYDNPEKRVFFTSKSYLPGKTPSGLKFLREKELTLLRGKGKGERQDFDRIYDYDVYNDLAMPELGWNAPVLGGQDHPYPRRCRTGRPMNTKDPKTESRVSSDVLFYVPRDENFSAIKGVNFGATALYTLSHQVIPTLNVVSTDFHRRFPYFTEIDLLYNEGVHVPPLKDDGLLTALPRLIKTASDARNNLLKFETPETIDRDKFSWFRDEEFCRQMLAGINPCCIELVKEWPLMGKLDPAIYGSPESVITKEIVENGIKGFMTLEEAIEQKKLFLLDYHDQYLPYVNKVRELERTTMYGSRTLMFLTPVGTLRPLAIELTRPPGNGKPQWKHVYTPCWDATGHWLWRFAKAHVLAQDSGYHQLVSHWLRTHCVTEPYIIATNRQLSEMHPIYRLLSPHLRYTMMINALARLILINSNGIIELTFSPRKYCMELSSAVYKVKWRFDHEALPADLISRGMAVEDPTAPHGLKLTIEDYPFANDGLILWDSIKQWVSDYVSYYYPDVKGVEDDQELQAWWTEIRTVGHGDLKNEPWWPTLKTPDDLISILSTIIWVTSGHHAAVNFGQYDFAGYMPNRPTICRTNMPDEDPSDDDWQSFLKRPEDVLMECFPSKLQAMTVMSVLDVLSSHSPDEEYIGQIMEPSWKEDPNIKAAFERFSARLKKCDGIIDERNANSNLKNRYGAGVVPYTLLKPFSDKSGVTMKGVPNSISI